MCKQNRGDAVKRGDEKGDRTFLFAILIAVLAVGMLVTFVDAESAGRRVGSMFRGATPLTSARSTAASATPASLADGFSIVEWHMDGPNSIGSIYVRGEVRNGNSVAAGVQLQAIARDASGRIVDSADFWPGSTQNIGAGTTAPIGHPVTRKPEATKFELRIISARVW